VRAVSLKYWSAIRQVRIDGMRTYRYSGGGRNCRNQITLADQRWPVVSSNETMAGTRKSCTANCRRNADVDRRLLSTIDNTQRRNCCRKFTTSGWRHFSPKIYLLLKNSETLLKYVEFDAQTLFSTRRIRYVESRNNRATCDTCWQNRSTSETQPEAVQRRERGRLKIVFPYIGFLLGPRGAGAGAAGPT